MPLLQRVPRALRFTWRWCLQVRARVGPCCCPSAGCPPRLPPAPPCCRRRRAPHSPPSLSLALTSRTPTGPPKERLPALVAAIVGKGMRAGVCIKPGTPVSELIPVLRACPDLTLALVMTVEPGFGGQSFMPAMMPKVAELRAHFPMLDIQVDGGVDCATVAAAAAAGANVIVSGTGVFRARDGPAQAIADLRKAVTDAQAL